MSVDSSLPLHALLDADPHDLATAASPPTPGTTSRVNAEVGIHGFINRLLWRAELPPDTMRDLTSHSFLRGGAQYANGEERLASQWILDRGA